MSKAEKSSFRKQVFKMIEVGFVEDFVSRTYDYINLLAILANLAVSVLFTFESIDRAYHGTLILIEWLSVVFFLVDYCLRVWTADYLYPNKTPGVAVFKYAISFSGIIDLLSFLPFFLPVFFPVGSTAFRLIRVIRIFKIFRVNAYSDSMNVITEVLRAKKQQLLSSIFIISILIISSSLCMYSLEHSVQPDVFENAFSGIWWSVSTLLTVGYGDIYPITFAGRVFGIIITFLGVGMVAIPTGILSAGFVEQDTKARELMVKNGEVPLQFVKIIINPNGEWYKKSIKDIELSGEMLIVTVYRDNNAIMPDDKLVLEAGDIVVVYTQRELKDSKQITI